MNSFDWSLFRSFLAVVETGSLSAAAKRLGLSQPTLGRHIRDLEAACGATLFARSVRGLEPTEAATGLIGDAVAMGAAADTLALKMQGRSKGLAGTVRITASVIVANLILPEILARLRNDEPEIQIELLASDETHDLLRREADIAIRMTSPAQPSLLARKIGESAIGLFGERGYVARHGRPQSIGDLLNHHVIGFDSSDAIIRAYAENAITARREHFPIRCDDQMVAWNLLLAGAGLGFAQVMLARRQTNLEQIELDLHLPTLPFWVVLHEDVRMNIRVRRVADVLSSELTKILAAA